MFQRPIKFPLKATTVRKVMGGKFPKPHPDL